MGAVTVNPLGWLSGSSSLLPRAARSSIERGGIRRTQASVIAGFSF
jgi:hypothetical protein